MKNPKIAIFTSGNATACFLDGKGIGANVQGLKYSARDKNGELRPTLELLNVDVGANGFSWDDESQCASGYASLAEFLVERLGVTVEDIEAAKAVKKSREAQFQANMEKWKAGAAVEKARNINSKAQPTA